MASEPASSSLTPSKVFHLVRHGQTVMNAYLGQCTHQYGTIDFEDPMLFDTELTYTGILQARALQKQVDKGLSPPPQVIISSPLSRALRTAELVFQGVSCPRLAHALAAECLWLSSDVGTPRSQLVTAFPAWGFDELAEEHWWYTGGTNDPRAIFPESSGRFLIRMEKLRAYLLSRSEACIVFVAHAGVLKALTGHSFRNCELRTLTSEDLKVQTNSAFLV